MNDDNVRNLHCQRCDGKGSFAVDAPTVVQCPSCKGWWHEHKARADAAEVSLASETQKREALERERDSFKRIGQQFEADSRKHFDKSCEWMNRATAAEARVKELEEALREMTPAPGFPKCDSRCSSNRHSCDEDNRCDCGMDEIRHRAEAARAALSTPKVKP